MADDPRDDRDDRRDRRDDPRRRDRRPLRWQVKRTSVPERAEYSAGGPEIVVSALITLGERPIEGRDVKILLDGGSQPKKPFGDTYDVQTNPDGWVAQVISLEGAALGRHSVAFQLPGTEPLVSVIRFFALPPPPKPYKDIRRAYSGSAGKYELTIILGDLCEQPVAGTVEIACAGKRTVVEVPTIGAKHQVEFSAEKETVRLRVVEAPDVTAEDELAGCKFTGEPPPPPEPKRGDSRWAFLRYRNRTGKTFDWEKGEWK